VSIQIPVIEAPPPPPSPARVHPSAAPPLRIGVVQHAWSTAGLIDWLGAAIDAAAAHGARIVFLPEITLSRYPADTLPTGVASELAEDLDTGPTIAFARAAARRNQVYVHASVYRRAEVDDGVDDGLGLNTAVIVDPSGDVVATTNKLHILPRRASDAAALSGLHARGSRTGADRAADVLGRVVPGGSAGVLARRRQHCRLSHRDRLRTRSP
jgi:predicted amidohydrolase